MDKISETRLIAVHSFCVTKVKLKRRKMKDDKMNNLNKIIAMRLKHSFYEHKETYLNFIKHYRKTYKAEYYLTKHLCFLQNHRLAKKFITKATKAEPNNKYIMGVYHLYNKNNEKAVECFLASKGQNRYFDDEIDSYLLSIDPKNINVISECWNGIKLEFKDENDKKEFDELKIREGNTFQVKLQNKITKFLRKKKEMKIVKKQKCEQTLIALIELKEFLSSNFITNEYVDNMEKELTKLKEFFCNVESYRKGDLSAEEKITNFESVLMDVKAVKIAISEKLVKRMVYEKMMKRFEVKENKIGMPFLPIFYDMAYDYVQYPSEQSNVEKLLKGFSFFSRK